MTATQPRRTLRILRTIETGRTTITDVIITRDGKEDAYRVIATGDAVTFAHDSMHVRSYTVRAGKCNCAAAKYARVAECVHVACAAKLLALNPTADANPAPPKFDDRGADLQGGF